MGQKIHPQLFRLGTSAKWQSRWFDTRKYAKWLVEDYQIRKLAFAKFKKAAIADVEIERFANATTVTIHSSRPGVIIGRGGAGVETFKKEVVKLTKTTVEVNIQEVRNPESNAAIVATNIAEQIERRIPFRRVIKQAVDAAKQARVQGVRIVVAGRLNGAEIARTEMLSFGKVPLHTIKQPIEYAFRVAYTTYGTIGIKVWILNQESTATDQPTNG
ncbi:TPA: 30S ribosomal protein S3 [Patescibacteria group bacterium]|uniref:Small ribosomal subunit protein uS3 n=3 Tax=root TaxID=1 RepID=A0A0G1X7B3_UNCK3|nr:30S ribosomal protein S3 [uncultured organism]AKM84777.1 MAG: 30S ribosomal protein S3, small subunit ribosomal protein S3 [candidate division Kazan bacterium GW2011_GWA1_50_15]KKW25403.1 MAG: 30S ribosomal protein S3 [candidate division Kazan bacterium GW2011_GWC1_52_13]KKW26710.1 MAG: 30S ribosomal protein S3 [candidate division Kazan bacterium GW2011_GWB1_52_7]HAV65707.1 30S ribosomal protein S3 [Patescibacteria group bacterium]